MKKALVVGATSGIGHALVLELVKNGWQVVASGRRTELLESLQSAAPDRIFIQVCDITDVSLAREHVFSAAHQLGGLDAVIVNAGVSTRSTAFDWEPDYRIIQTNITGFAACAHAAMEVFFEQGYGHLLGIGSVAGQLSLGRSAAYNASKAFVSNYLRGLRLRAYQKKKPVFVTDVRPGFIDTPMTDGLKGKFWSVSAETGAALIFRVMQRPKKVVYIPEKWRFVAFIARMLPDWILKKVF